MTWKRDRLASLIRSPTTRKDACFVASGRKPKTARVCCTGAVLFSPRRISDLPAKPLNRYPNSQSPTRASVPGQLFRMRSSRGAPRREDAEKLEGIGLARQMLIAQARTAHHPLPTTVQLNRQKPSPWRNRVRRLWRWSVWSVNCSPSETALSVKTRQAVPAATASSGFRRRPRRPETLREMEVRRRRAMPDAHHMALAQICAAF